ncbi:hypothetical protein H0H87_004378, partial [Tephrocybe sp. NHM501043]
MDISRTLDEGITTGGRRGRDCVLGKPVGFPNDGDSTTIENGVTPTADETCVGADTDEGREGESTIIEGSVADGIAVFA